MVWGLSLEYGRLLTAVSAVRFACNETSFNVSFTSYSMDAHMGYHQKTICSFFGTLSPETALL